MKQSAARVGGPLGPFARGFQAELVEQGYRPSSVVRWLRYVAQLSAWLGGRDLTVGDLAPSRVEEFLDEVAWTSAYRRRTMGLTCRRLLGYLRGVGAVPVDAPAVCREPAQRLLADFGAYLVRERGVSSCTGTVRDYQRVGRLFLSTVDTGGGSLACLTTADVTRFVLVRCRGRSVRWGRMLVTALRSLLRFAYLEGLTAGDLAAAVPSVASWRGASLPRGVDAKQVTQLLGSCDRRTSAGRRDFAVLTLLARLGLRIGEVAALRVGDVDWRAGEITIRGKADRHERLPLPHDVGEALAGYLLRGRPHRAGAHLFVQVRAPYGPVTRNSVGEIVARAAHRAGLPRLGAHRLRHTVATDLLRAGAPLAEIAGVLRHRSTATTAIYAKVDRSALRGLAHPWPGGAA
ncbi:MAG TPA: site-specific integrase [Micromonosporaceae bacterium]|nr:site-specific integrase [Micromonosporaceae bacterium]